MSYKQTNSDVITCFTGNQRDLHGLQMLQLVLSKLPVIVAFCLSILLSNHLHTPVPRWYQLYSLCPMHIPI